jgi:type IV secretory pathway VirB2 component (pilin)
MLRLATLLFLLILPHLAMAEDEIFGVAIEQGQDIFTNAKPILQGLALLAILGVGSMALFGKMPWGWAFGIIGAMALVMIAAEVKDWIVEIGGQPTGEGFAGVSEGVKKVTDDVHTDAQALIYIAAAVAAMALGIVAMFGRMPWGRFFALVGGLGLIVISTSVVDSFFTDGQQSTAALYDDANQFVTDSFISTERIVYGIAGLGLMAVGAMAYFGRFQWGWVMATMGGLAVIAGVGTLIEYVTNVNPYN